MTKKSKLLKIWTRTTTYLTMIGVLVLCTEPLSAGYVYDGTDPNNGNPRRMIQVVFAIKNEGVEMHPDPNVKSASPKPRFTDVNNVNDENIVREYMKNLQPPISGETHIQFWRSKDQGTQILHTRLALFGAAGAQENAYISAINNILQAQPPQLDLNIKLDQVLQKIEPANVTFSLHVK